MSAEETVHSPDVASLAEAVKIMELPLPSRATTPLSQADTQLADDPDPCTNPCKHHPHRPRDAPHAKKLDRFITDVVKTLRRVYPRQPGSFYVYDKAHILLLRWQDDDLNTKTEIDELQTLFRALHLTDDDEKKCSFNSYCISSEDFADEMETLITTTKNQYAKKASDLLIIYYGGHAKMDESQRCIWYPSLDVPDGQWDMPELDWTKLQDMFHDRQAHIVFILDSCHAGSAARQTKFASRWKGVQELVVACGKNERTEAVNDNSFTRALIRELKEFRTSGEHCTLRKIVSNLATKNHGLRNAPLHIGLSDKANTSETWQIVFRDQNLASKATKPTTRNSNDFDTRVLLSLRLQHPLDPTDVPDWDRWLKLQAPKSIGDIDIAWAETWKKCVRLEGSFDHGSALLLVSIPERIWKNLPKYPEYSFIDYVKSDNLLIPTLLSQPREIGSTIDASTQTEEQASAREPYHAAQDQLMQNSRIDAWLEQGTQDADRATVPEDSDAISIPETQFSDLFSDTRSTTSSLQTVFTKPMLNSALQKLPDLPPIKVSDYQLLRTEPRPDIEEFKYSRLSSNTNQTRLIRLYPGAADNPELTCQIFDVEFDENLMSPYQTLSWDEIGLVRDFCYILMKQGGNLYQQRISKELGLALKHLRHHTQSRLFWIDTLSIDQHNVEERGCQAAMMHRIFGNATSLCAWIGQKDANSTLAIRFIMEHIRNLANIDKILSDTDNAPQFAALVELMQRPFFTRKQSVSEIVLSRRTVLICGEDQISWSDFATAVELFIEVETATHRLSEVMKRDVNSRHDLRWTEHLSQLGASLLVDLTARFSKNRTPLKSGSNRGNWRSLENLVSNLSMFRSALPHDCIYPLVNIADDAQPIQPDWCTSPHSHPSQFSLACISAMIPSAPQLFPIDYDEPYVDVCKRFVQFAIFQRWRTQPEQALDILCRPWAQSLRPGALDTQARENIAVTGLSKWFFSDVFELKLEPFLDQQYQPMNLPSWVSTVNRAPFALFHHPSGMLKMGRKDADPLVGLQPDGTSEYRAGEGRPMRYIKFRRRPLLRHFSIYVEGFVCDRVEQVGLVSMNGIIPVSWLQSAGWTILNDKLGMLSDPPDALWRTLVADRGARNRNPPAYYLRACKEMVKRGGILSGGIDTNGLIYGGENSALAQFCLRVQVTIWNRALVITEKGRLGLVHPDVQKGDLVCVLWGCSVPVIMRHHKKTDDERDLEVFEDRFEMLKRVVKRKEERNLGTKAFENTSGLQIRELTEKHVGQSEAQMLQYHELFGEAYIHGIMDGEAVRELQEEENTWEGESKERRDTTEQIFEIR